MVPAPRRRGSVLALLRHRQKLAEDFMAKRISRCVELLEQDQAIYYDGPHTGHVLTHEQGASMPTPGPTTSMSAWSTARST